jgi:hypothetical protein
MLPQKPCAAHFIVDSAYFFFKKGIPVTAPMLPEIAPL